MRCTELVDRNVTPGENGSLILQAVLSQDRVHQTSRQQYAHYLKKK